MRWMLVVLGVLLLPLPVVAMGMYVDSGHPSQFVAGEEKTIDFYVKGDGQTRTVKFFILRTQGFLVNGADSYTTQVQVNEYDTVKVPVNFLAVQNGTWLVQWGFEEEGSGGMQMDFVTKDTLQLQVGSGGLVVEVPNTVNTTNTSSSSSSFSTTRRRVPAGGGGGAGTGTQVYVPTKENGSVTSASPQESDFVQDDSGGGETMESIQPDTGIAQGIVGDESYAMAERPQQMQQGVVQTNSEEANISVQSRSPEAKVFLIGLLLFGVVVLGLQFVVYKKMRDDA